MPRSQVRFSAKQSDDECRTSDREAGRRRTNPGAAWRHASLATFHRRPPTACFLPPYPIQIHSLKPCATTSGGAILWLCTAPALSTPPWKQASSGRRETPEHGIRFADFRAFANGYRLTASCPIGEVQHSLGDRSVSPCPARGQHDDKPSSRPQAVRLALISLCPSLPLSNPASPASLTVLSNAAAALAIPKDAAKIGESVPYLEGIAGLLSTALKMWEVRQLFSWRSDMNAGYWCDW